jgi:hypothetical protein
VAPDAMNEKSGAKKKNADDYKIDTKSFSHNGRTVFEIADSTAASSRLI